MSSRSVRGRSLDSDYSLPGTLLDVDAKALSTAGETRRLLEHVVYVSQTPLTNA
jgi:hypothetical protein